MKYRQLGKSGLTVSELCLGTMTFGSNFYNIGVLGQSQSTEMVLRALEEGVNFFDTADVYSYGQSETILGQAFRDLKIEREHVVIATKVRGAMGDEKAPAYQQVNQGGLSRKHILAGCDASLKRLGTDYIDLYQVHGWDKMTPIEETLSALHQLVEDGKVRYIGCSNWAARQLAKGLMLSELKGWNRFVSLQAYYSLAGRDLEHELRPLCHEEGLGILPWSPLSGGFLSGKYRSTDAAGRRTTFDFPPIDQERGSDALAVLEEIAQQKEVTMPQVALAWLLAQPAVTSVIIGASKMPQLEDNLQAYKLELTPDQLQRLNEVTQPHDLYPGWMIKRQNGETSWEHARNKDGILTK